MTERLLAVACTLAMVSACGGDHRASSPTTPSAPTPPTETRIIALSGNLAFGTVDIGHTVTTTLTISNNGNSALSVSNVTVPSGSTFVTSWWKGTIAAGTSQPVTVYFSPQVAQTYEGVLTVVGDQTSGTSTMNISGTGK
ncbi:MAG: choice-of-anchor D domain-containing protein, partial [Bacteroidales bacterium]